MKFDPDLVICEPGYFSRSWQSCDYIAPDGSHLFHERLYHTQLLGKGGLWSRLLAAKTEAEKDAIANAPERVSCWMPGEGTRAEIEVLATKHGGQVMESHYCPDGADSCFLAFDDTDKALAFCQTEDFDRLAYPLRAGTGGRLAD